MVHEKSSAMASTNGLPLPLSSSAMTWRMRCLLASVSAMVGGDAVLMKDSP
jgi:hypothetical protein